MDGLERAARKVPPFRGGRERFGASFEGFRHRAKTREGVAQEKRPVDAFFGVVVRVPTVPVAARKARHGELRIGRHERNVREDARNPERKEGLVAGTVEAREANGLAFGEGERAARKAFGRRHRRGEAVERRARHAEAVEIHVQEGASGEFGSVPVAPGGASRIASVAVPRPDDHLEAVRVRRFGKGVENRRRGGETRSVVDRTGAPAVDVARKKRVSVRFRPGKRGGEHGARDPAAFRFDFERHGTVAEALGRRIVDRSVRNRDVAVFDARNGTAPDVGDDHAVDALARDEENARKAEALRAAQNSEVREARHDRDRGFFGSLDVVRPGNGLSRHAETPGSARARRDGGRHGVPLSAQRLAVHFEVRVRNG